MSSNQQSFIDELTKLYSQPPNIHPPWCEGCEAPAIPTWNKTCHWCNTPLTTESWNYWRTKTHKILNTPPTTNQTTHENKQAGTHVHPTE